MDSSLRYGVSYSNNAATLRADAKDPDKYIVAMSNLISSECKEYALDFSLSRNFFDVWGIVFE